MKRAVLVFLLVCGALGGAEAPEFQLEIGGRRYAVKPDEPVVVESPKGETFQVSLVRRAEREYKSMGVSFRYGSGEVRRHAAAGHTALLLFDTDAAFALECFAEGISRGDFLAGYAKGFAKSGVKRSFDPAGAPALLNAGGVKWEGSSHLSGADGDAPVLTRIFFLQRGRATWVWIEQGYASRLASARNIELIRKSFAFDAEK